MYCRIDYHSDIPPTFQELHYFLALPRHRCPTRFRVRVLLQSTQIFSIELKIAICFSFRLAVDRTEKLSASSVTVFLFSTSDCRQTFRRASSRHIDITDCYRQTRG